MRANLRLLFGLILKNFLLSTIKDCSGIVAGMESGWCGAKREKVEGIKEEIFPQSLGQTSVLCVVQWVWVPKSNSVFYLTVFNLTNSASVTFCNNPSILPLLYL